MAGKPRIMVRLDPGVLATLEWYARARARTTAEIAGELIGQAVAAALADADLRGALERQGGPPPDVPLVALIGHAGERSAGIAPALATLRRLGEELVPLSPIAAGQVRVAARQVEGALVLLRDALDVAARRRHGNGKRDVVPPAPPIDCAASGPAPGIVTKGQ